MKFIDPKEFYKTVPKKRMGVGALILDEDNKILIVKPSYRPDWSMPGGIVDQNESPRAACIREVKEEVDLDVKEAKFLVVAYKPDREGKGDSLQFFFYCGTLSRKESQNVHIDNDEIVEYKFAAAEEAKLLLNKALAERLEAGLKMVKAGAGVYLEI